VNALRDPRNGVSRSIFKIQSSKLIWRKPFKIQNSTFKIDMARAIQNSKFNLQN
jgi:hypothetical protein